MQVRDAPRLSESVSARREQTPSTREPLSPALMSIVVDMTQMYSTAQVATAIAAAHRPDPWCSTLPWRPAASAAVCRRPYSGALSIAATWLSVIRPPEVWDYFSPIDLGSHYVSVGHRGTIHCFACNSVGPCRHGTHGTCNSSIAL